MGVVDSGAMGLFCFAAAGFSVRLMIYAGWRLGLSGAAGKSVSGPGPEHDFQARLPCCGGYLTESLAFFPQASSEDGASVSWTLMASSSPPAQPAVGTVPQGPGGHG